MLPVHFFVTAIQAFLRNSGGIIMSPLPTGKAVSVLLLTPATMQCDCQGSFPLFFRMETSLSPGVPYAIQPRAPTSVFPLLKMSFCYPATLNSHSPPACRKSVARVFFFPPTPTDEVSAYHSLFFISPIARCAFIRISPFARRARGVNYGGGLHFRSRFGDRVSLRSKRVRLLFKFFSRPPNC